MPIALVVGQYDPGDPVVRAFQDKALTLGYDPAHEVHYPAAPSLLVRPAETGEHHLVLFCVPIGLHTVGNLLRSFRLCRRRMIVYVHTARASTDEAIKYCTEGLADGYLVMGDATSEQSVRDLAVRLHRLEAPYARIAFGWPLDGARATAFISTPFDRDNRAVMESAVDLALKKLGFEVEWGDRDYRQSLHDHIRNEIRRCSLLVANISVDRRDARHNPNVYFEAGMAAASDLPIIFVRRAGEEDVSLPTDIHGRRWLSYDNEIDLALKLYHGLKPCPPTCTGVDGCTRIGSKSP